MKVIPFKDSMHDDTADGFKFEKNFKGEVAVRIYQEFDTGEVKEIYLSHDDIKQMNAELIEFTREEVK